MIKLRITTPEQYNFAEIDGDWDSPETAYKAYHEYFTAFNGHGPTSPDLCTQLIEIIDSDLTKHWGSVDAYKAMPIHEQAVMQALKRLKARLKDHNKQD